MTLADRLLARISRPVGRLPEYVAPRCLRRRFLRSTCDLCARECPVQALYPGESLVRLDSERCTGCLACTAVCPSEALVARDTRQAKVAERVFAWSGVGSAVLCCEKALRDGTELLLPCLGILSREELALFALLAGSVTLVLHPCRDCHSPQVPELLQRRVDQLAELWEQGRGERGDQQAAPPRIELRFTAAPPVPAQADSGRGAAPSSAHPSPQDRRDFFRAFKTLSIQAAAETWGAFREEPVRPEEQWASSKHLPARLLLLRQAWQRLEAEPERRTLLLPLISIIEVGSTCTGCEACVGLCPSGALSSDSDDPDPVGRLFFDWSRCSGCGLCGEFCPARAITLRRAADPAEIGENPREIFRPPAGDPAAADNGSPRRHS